MYERTGWCKVCAEFVAREKDDFTCPVCADKMARGETIEVWVS